MVRNDFARKLGKRLSGQRKALRLEQQEVANALGATSASYGNWERGDRLFPVDLLSKLPAIFGKPVTYFLGMPSDSELADDEYRLLAMYRGSPKEIRALIMRSVEAMAQED